jgi:4-oxalocrotonate tautomerase
MPFVNAKLCAKPSPALTGRVALALTDLTVEVLGKERARTTVVVEYVPEEQWALGGALLARGFYVEVKITSRKNSRDEKARYVRQVNRALQGLLGASGYVAVDEIPADSWGYAGETQEVRYARAALAKESMRANPETA